MRLDAYAASDVGLVRKSNQDAIGSFPDLQLFVVADGMGGHADGEVASRLAVEAVHGFFADGSAAPAAASDLERLKLAVERAHGRIQDEAQRCHQSPGARSLGTTVVALKLTPADQLASWVHVGDSRLYRLRGGELALLTADHTYFGHEYLNQEVIPTSLPHTNQLVQALGIEGAVDVAAAASPWQVGDLFLLCSDGISGQLDVATLQAQLAARGDLQSIGDALLRAARDAGGKDNASGILVRVSDA